MRGEGSGFIISSDGLILTNAHVVQDAKEVTVKLTDRREYQAKVLGADPQTDVAVLKIEAKNLPVVKTGDVNQLQVGEWVLAIGSPYGLENTATAGIVSAKGRSLPDDTSVPFIQTDVAVNPGNSGGPLFNDRGEVVGINSQIYSRTGGFQGVLLDPDRRGLQDQGPDPRTRQGMIAASGEHQFADLRARAASGLSFSIPIDVAYKIRTRSSNTARSARAAGRDGAGIRPGQFIQAGNADGRAGRQRRQQRRRTRRPAAGRCGAADQRQDHRVVRRPGVDDHAGLARRQAQAGCLAQWLAQGTERHAGRRAEGQGDRVVRQDVQRGQLGLALRPLSPQSSASPAPRVCSSSSPPAPRPAYPGDVLLSLNGVPVRDIGRNQAAKPAIPSRCWCSATKDLRAGADRLIRAYSGLPGAAARGRQLAAGRVDAHRGHGGQVALQATRVGHLRHQADIGDGGRVAVAIAAGGGRGRQLRLEGLQPLVHPMAVPGVLGVFVHAQVCFRYFSTRRLFSGCVSQAMPSARSRTRAADGVGRQQRRLRMGFFQVFDDGQRLADDHRRRSAWHQRRGIELAVVGRQANHSAGSSVRRRDRYAATPCARPLRADGWSSSCSGCRPPAPDRNPAPGS